MSNRKPAYGEDALKFELKVESPELITLDCENMELAHKRKLIDALDRVPYLDAKKDRFNVSDPWLIEFYLVKGISPEQVEECRRCIKAAVYYFCQVPEPQGTRTVTA